MKPGFKCVSLVFNVRTYQNPRAYRRNPRAGSDLNGTLSIQAGIVCMDTMPDITVCPGGYEDKNGGGVIKPIHKQEQGKYQHFSFGICYGCMS